MGRSTSRRRNRRITASARSELRNLAAALGRPRIFARVCFLGLDFEMKKLFLLPLILVACETANYAPRVTPTMTRSTSRAKQNVDVVKLERGRNLFVRRCIECHTLPAMWKYSRDDWPKIVNDMSHRASLKPAERDAVIAYI